MMDTKKMTNEELASLVRAIAITSSSRYERDYLQEVAERLENIIGVIQIKEGEKNEQE